jgi:hypothetical protein
MERKRKGKKMATTNPKKLDQMAQRSKWMIMTGFLMTCYAGTWGTIEHIWPEWFARVIGTQTVEILIGIGAITFGLFLGVIVIGGLLRWITGSLLFAGTKSVIIDPEHTDSITHTRKCHICGEVQRYWNNWSDHGPDPFYSTLTAGWFKPCICSQFRRDKGMFEYES